MPLDILELGKQFRPSTSIVYPPFKNGRYMEEYFYDYMIKQKDTNNNNNSKIESGYVYIPVFWTNIQNHPNFSTIKTNYNILLKRAYSLLPENTKYFTVVQNDDGVQLDLPKNTVVFGACSGAIPLPLIYEDVSNRLLNTPRLSKKSLLASFVGTYTHPLRQKLFSIIGKKSTIQFSAKTEWTSAVSELSAVEFIEQTLKSKFCLAPRGYGRSSFRFFEAMLLDTVPVYFWDDIEWLPYKDILDYSKFSISIQEKNIGKTYDILKSISNETYVSMLDEIKRVRHWFTLEGMSEYIFTRIQNP